MQLSAKRCCIIAVFQVILLGFVAIAFCLSSQHVFILVFDRCNLRCSNGCFEITWNLYWILLKNRRHYIGKAEMLKSLSMKTPWKEPRVWRFWVFRSPTMLPPTYVSRNKTLNISQNHKQRMNKSHFGNPRRVRFVVWNMLANSKWGHERVMEYG